MPTKHPYDPDLLSVSVSAGAVLRRMKGLARLMGGISTAWRSPTLDESMVIVGDAGQMAVSLNLALEAAARYVKSNLGVELPMPKPDFESLRTRAKAARDAVAHWDDKLGRASDTRLEVNGVNGLKVVAPGKVGTTSVTTVISWTEAKQAARQCLRWVSAVRGASS